MVAIHKLSAGRVEAEISSKVKTPKLISDGGGLYLQVARSGSVSWILRYRSPTTGKTRDTGLGPVHKMSLANARKEAARLRQMIHVDRCDPIEEREKKRTAFERRFEQLLLEKVWRHIKENDLIAQAHAEAYYEQQRQGA